MSNETPARSDTLQTLNYLELEHDQGPDKVLPLNEAIRRYVLPGMIIHVGEHANATVRELLRQFREQSPRFTVIAPSTQDCVTDLIHVGQVSKLIFALGSEVYPKRGPSKVLQRACRDGRLELENWSLCSLIQRLMAGAMGIPCMPTRSLAGSTIATDNSESFKQVRDPFGSGEALGLVRALQPDISLVHGWAADRSGNVVIDPFSFASQGSWGALASKVGVIATVEEVVSTDYVRRHSHLVKIPSHRVLSVSNAKLGKHPQGMSNHGIDRLAAYGPDYEFLRGHRDASSDPKALDAWIKEWILERTSNDDYVDRLGPSRIKDLFDRGSPDSWKKELSDRLSTPRAEENPSSSEAMVLAAAGEIAELVKDRGYKTILVGAGAPALAAWLAYYRLRKTGQEVELAMGTGVLGYIPRPATTRVPDGIANISTATMIADTTHIYSVVVGGTNSKCLSVLGAGQIDRHGNINLTRTSSGVFLTGSGGANDAAAAAEIVVVARQSIDRFVEQVPYITCPGERVTTIVSDKGVYRRSAPGGEMELAALLPGSGQSDLNTRVDDLRRSCGWPLRIRGNIREIPSPSQEELSVLRVLDPFADGTA